MSTFDRLECECECDSLANITDRLSDCMLLKRTWWGYCILRWVVSDCFFLSGKNSGMRFDCMLDLILLCCIGQRVWVVVSIGSVRDIWWCWLCCSHSDCRHCAMLSHCRCRAVTLCFFIVWMLLLRCHIVARPCYIYPSTVVTLSYDEMSMVDAFLQPVIVAHLFSLCCCVCLCVCLFVTTSSARNTHIVSFRSLIRIFV